MKEITRLGLAMGGEAETFAGLTGMGDLIVTCTSMHSRNRRCGILIGQGKLKDEAVEEIGMVVEGVKSCVCVYNLSKQYSVEMPIVETAYKVLYENLSPLKAVKALMTREKKEE
jgi:glycerol-3-phosphate dehydrogenase (NAD(P)+)